MYHDEIIRDLIIGIFLENEHSPEIFAEYHIHKILYLYKKNIEDKDPQLSNDIPYYWYLYGVYSQPVRNWLRTLSENKILSRQGIVSLYGTEGSLFTLNKSRLETPYHPHKKVKETIDDLWEAVRSFINTKEKLFKEGSSFNPGRQFNKMIYEKYAPFPFQTMYNMTYLDLFYNIDYSDKKRFKKRINEFKNILTECEAELPIEEPFLSDFNDAFISYVTTTNRLLRYYERDGENYCYIKTILEPTSNIVWETFAHGLRVVNDAHESYYNENVDAWKGEYFEKISQLSLSLDGYKTSVLNAVGEKGLTKVDAEASKEFLTSVIGGYFSKGGD